MAAFWLTLDQLPLLGSGKGLDLTELAFSEYGDSGT